MTIKFVILAFTLAYANAGNLVSQPAAVHYSSAPAVSSSYFQQVSVPVAYAKTLAAPAVAAVHASPSIAYHAAPQAVAVHAPSIGLSQESVARSLGGAQSVSTYSKAVDSAFSSVRKYDTRITNDALSYGPAQVAYSAPLVAKTYAAPTQVAYASPAPIAYAAQAPVAYAKSYAAPAQLVSYNAPAPQVVSYGAPAPVAYAKTYGAPAQVVSYNAPAPVAYAKTYAAPAQVVSYNAPAPVAYAKTYAAPSQVVSYNTAPVVAKTYAAPASVFSYNAPAPVYAKTVAPVATYAAHAPVQYAAGPAVVTKAAVGYSPAVGVAHTTFQGYGIEYHY